MDLGSQYPILHFFSILPPHSRCPACTAAPLLPIPTAAGRFLSTRPAEEPGCRARRVESRFSTANLPHGRLRTPMKVGRFSPDEAPASAFGSRC